MSDAPRAMILAAGYGTRLGELSEVRPKPMLPICGTPLVRWAVLWLRHHGVREIVINLHHLGEQIEAELGDGSALGVDIAYSPEHGEILGTGGGLRKARPLLDDGSGRPIVVVNGKILVDLPLSDVLASHARREAEATMVLRADPDAERWGSLRLDPSGRVGGFLGLTHEGQDQLGPPLMFTGVQVLSPRFLDRIPPQGQQCVVRTAYRELFDQRGALFGHVTDRYWWEHSTPQRYLQGTFNVLDGIVDLPYAEHPVTGIDPTARIAPDATVHEPVWIGPDVEIGPGAIVGPHAALGRGSAVAAGSMVRRAVVWPNARVDGDLVDAVAPGPTAAILSR